MPEKEQQDKTLSEIVVKEAVGKGLDSPMRDSILEAVEEADSSKRRRRLPLVGAVFGLGAALGFLAGQQSSELKESPLENLEEPEIIEDVTERVEAEAETDTTLTDDEESEMVETESEGSSSSRLPKLLLMLGVVAGAVLLRRRLSGESEEEWEPIEEFEPATTAEGDEESDESEGIEAETEDESEGDEEAAEADESEEEYEE